MKRIKDISCFIIIVGICIYVCISCHHKSDDGMYFNGEIHIVKDSVDDVENVKLKPIVLKGANYGWVAVYDSLMLFFNPKLPNHFYNVFNIDTGEEIGTFCNRGNGPNEVVSLGPVFQFFKEGNDLKTLLFAPNEEKLLFWNVTKSIEQNETVFERILPYEWRNKNGGACYHEIFFQNKDTLLAKVSSFPISNEEATLPFYQKRTVDTNECLISYSMYKQSIKNGEASIIPESFFYSNDTFKPDGTKIVQVMTHFPQFNIMDVRTGKVVGYRLNEGTDFSVFEGRQDIKWYFGNVQANDNYIYASYLGKKQWEDVKIIYVFDWNGKLVRKLATDYAIGKMWIDIVRNRLYTTEPITDEVFYLDLNELET